MSNVLCRSLVFVFLSLMVGMAMAGDPMKGRSIYENRCAGCHGQNGTPQVPEIPNFKMGQGLMQSDQQLLSFVKRGKGVMPGFEGVMTDAEIRDVIAHIRTFF